MQNAREYVAPVPWDESRRAEVEHLSREMEALRSKAGKLHAEAQTLSRYGDEGARRFQIEMQVSTLRADVREIAERLFDLSEKRQTSR